MSSKTSPATAALLAKVKEANDFLAHDRHQFLSLSLAKFTVKPGAPALVAQNLEEISKEQEKESSGKWNGNGVPFGTKVSDRVAISKAHKLGEKHGKKKLMAAAHELLKLAVGEDWAQPEPPAFQSPTVARLSHLTACLWRYIPLAHMTTFHLWSLLDTVKGITNFPDDELEGELSECVSDLIEPLGIIARNKSANLEAVSVTLQVLAALPDKPYQNMHNVVLDALVAFSRVPRVIDNESSIKNKANRLRWILEHGDAQESAKRQSMGIIEKASTPALSAVPDASSSDDKLLVLEKDGSTAAATLLDRFCENFMSLAKVNVPAREKQDGDKFEDKDLVARSAQLLTVLSKLGSHNTELLAKVSPLIFEAIDRDMERSAAEGVTRSKQSINLQEVGTILSKLPQNSGAFAFGASLIAKLDIQEAGHKSLDDLLASVRSGDPEAYVALATLQASNRLASDTLARANAAEALIAALDMELKSSMQESGNEPTIPPDLLFSMAALASTDLGYDKLSNSGGIDKLLKSTLRFLSSRSSPVNQAVSSEAGESNRTKLSVSNSATPCQQTLDLVTVLLLGPNSIGDSPTNDIFVVDGTSSIEALPSRHDVQMQLAEEIMHILLDDLGSIDKLLEEIRKARDSTPLGRESQRYLTAIAILPRLIPENYAEVSVVEKPPVGGFLSTLLNCPRELRQLSVLTAVPQYSEGIFQPRNYDLDEVFVLMQQALHAGDYTADNEGLRDSVSNEKMAAFCADIIGNALEVLPFHATIEAVDSLDMGVVAEEAVRGVNLCMGDDAAVQSFIALLASLPPRVALARGAVQAARAAIHNSSTKLAGLHLLHTIAGDMARFDDFEGSASILMPQATSENEQSVKVRKRRSHRGSVHRLLPRRQNVVEEDIAALMKSGGLQLVIDTIIDITSQNRASVGEERRLLATAIDTIQIVARCDPASRQKLLETLDVGTLLAEIMSQHAQTDQELTSLAASTLATLSMKDGQALRKGKKWRDGEDPKNGDALVMSSGDARLATSLISSLEGQDHDALMDVLGSENLLSEVPSANVDDDLHGSLMNNMIKTVVAQRLASKYANEEGISRLVSELDDPETSPERKNAVVTVLRRIADGQNRPPGVGRRRKRRGRHRGDYIPEAEAALQAEKVSKHLVDLKVAQKVAAALASSQSNDYRQDALHFLQSLTSNQQVDFGNQGLDASDLKLIAENVQISRSHGRGRHSQLLQQVDLMIERKSDTPADNGVLFDAIEDAALAVEKAGDVNLMKRLRSAMDTMGGKFALDMIGESGGMSAVVRAICLHGDEGVDEVEPSKKGGQRRLLKWCKLMREFVRDIYWAQVLAHEGGLIVAIQVIVKNMHPHSSAAEKKAKRVLRTSLVRVCCQLLADATFHCKANANHLFKLHIVKVMHGVMCSFPHNSSIIKAVSCLAINLCHDDTEAQRVVANGLLNKTVELLDEIMPNVMPLRKVANISGSEHNKHLEDEAAHAVENHSSAPPGLTRKSEAGERSSELSNLDKLGVDSFRNTKDQVIARWMLSLCFCFSFEDRCAIEMIFLGLVKTACAGLRIASASRNMELMSVCSSLLGNLIITALDDESTDDVTLRSHMVKRIWREECPETVIQILRCADDPGQLMLAIDILQAFVDNDDSSRRLLFAPAREYESKTSHHRSSSMGDRSNTGERKEVSLRHKTRKGRAAGLELVSLLLDRLTEFQWDLDFCEATIKVLARFSDLEDRSDRKSRRTGGTGAAQILVLAGIVQVLVSELEDCAMNKKAGKLASLCIACLDSIARVSADARRAVVKMGGTKVVAAVMKSYKGPKDKIGQNLMLDALSLLTRLCIDSSLIAQLTNDTIAAVMVSANAYSHHPRIVKSVFVLLTMLAFEVKTLELIRKQDAIGFVIDALCAMPDEVELVKNAIAVLETIGTASPDHALIVVNEGGKMAIQSKFFIFSCTPYSYLLSILSTSFTYILYIYLYLYVPRCTNYLCGCYCLHLCVFSCYQSV